jgi:hypothetical protein
VPEVGLESRAQAGVQGAGCFASQLGSSMSVFDYLLCSGGSMSLLIHTMLATAGMDRRGSDTMCGTLLTDGGRMQFTLKWECA